MSGHRETQPGGMSRYRQLRLTATHELGGSFSVSLYAKPLNHEWHEQQCMLRTRVEYDQRALVSTEDVIAALIHILREQLLPGVD